MALTVPELKAFMNYIFTNHKYQGWKPLITVLIGTGLRIGECLGLRWEDLDFENRTIDVNHNLVHRRVDEEGGTLHINTPKTKAGCRTVPMIQQVYDASKAPPDFSCPLQPLLSHEYICHLVELNSLFSFTYPSDTLYDGNG